MKGTLLTVGAILVTIVILFSVAAPTITAFADQFSKLLVF